MKKLFVSILLAAVFATTSTSADQPATNKLPVVPMMSAACSKEFIVEKDGSAVRYVCDYTKSRGVWAVFIADLSGKLKSLRIVMVDSSVYEWEVVNGYDSKGSPVLADGENGVHLDNTYTLDRRAWVRFYERHLRLPPLILQ